MASKFLPSALTAPNVPRGREDVAGGPRPRPAGHRPLSGASPAVAVGVCRRRRAGNSLAPASAPAGHPMNPRRHLLARGYAAAVITLRHVIPLAWIAAVVVATISLPDLASAPTAPLEALAAKNGAGSGAAAEATKRFGFPLSAQTAVVQRNPRGLSQAAQRRQLEAARTVFAHT